MDRISCPVEEVTLYLQREGGEQPLGEMKSDAGRSFR